MWRPFLAAFLLIGTLSFGFYIQSSVSEKTTQIEQNIPSSIQATAASQNLEIAYSDYLSSLNLFSSIYIHSALDEITDSFEKCFALLGLNDSDGYATEALHLKSLLSRLSVLDRPSIESIF